MTRYDHVAAVFPIRLAEASVLLTMGAIAHDAGDHTAAMAHWRAGLALMSDRGDPRMVADAFSRIAGVSMAAGAYRSALLLFGAAEGLRERVGSAMLWPADVTAAERSLAMLSTALGNASVAAILAEGRALSWAEVIAVVETMEAWKLAIPG